MSPEKIDKLKKILKKETPEINIEDISKNPSEVDFSLREILQEKMLLEQFSLAAEEKSDYDVSEIFSIVSHEIKTPLVPAVAYIDLLLSDNFGTLTDLQKQKLTLIRKSISDSIRIIDMFLLLKKFEQGEISETRETVDITAVLKGVISQINGKISLDTSNTASYKITKTMFEFAIKNIIQFCTDLSDSVSLSIKNGGNFSISINTDIVLTEEQCLNLFEKGYQIDRSTTRHTSGIGIELYLAKQILNYNQLRVSAFMNNGYLEFSIVPNLG